MDWKNFFKRNIVLIVIILLVLFGACDLKHKYNTMINMQETIKNQWAEIDNQLKRRYDLIPNLVNTVKGYAKHEKEVFTDIANARAKLAGATSINEKAKAASNLESAISRLLVIVERYPQLKADSHFTALMDELSGTENRLSVARMRYNRAVADYNKYIRMFPNNIYASWFGFKPAEYFKIPEKEKATPKVNF